MKKGVFMMLLALLVSAMFVQTLVAQGPTTQLAFLVDGSGSISSSGFQIMREGIAQAISDPSCVPHDGSLEFTAIQFDHSARTELPPTVITSANVGNVSNTIRNISQLGGGTDYEPAFDTAIDQVTNSTNFAGAARQVINITTDGLPGGVTTMETLRNRAVNNGFDEIDAEYIAFAVANNVNNTSDPTPNLTAGPVDLLSDLVYPQPASVHPPAPWPPTTSGWVREVANVNEFAATVCAKFQVVLQPVATPTVSAPTAVPEPATMILLGSGVAALGAYVNRRRKNAASVE